MGTSLLGFDENAMGSPSAIHQMLVTLMAQTPGDTHATQPGSPPPSTGPVVQPPPQGLLASADPMFASMPAANAQPSRPSLLHRVVQNLTTMNAPSGYTQSGLLSSPEMEAAKPGRVMSLLGHIDPLIGAALESRTAGRLDRTIEMKNVAAQTAQAAQAQQARQALATRFAPADTDTEADTLRKYKGLMQGYAQLGDHAMVASLAEGLKSMQGDHPQQYEPKVFQDKDGNLFPWTPGTPIPIGAKPYVPPQATAELPPRERFLADQKNKILDDFSRDTKKFDDVMGGWEVLSGALKNPSFATPFALADAYGRISNPGAVVRPTTMQMIEELGSLNQRFRKFASQNINGQLPPDLTKDLVGTIRSMVLEHKATFDRTRAQTLKRAKQIGITDLNEILPNFDINNPMATAPAAGQNVKGAIGGVP